MKSERKFVDGEEVVWDIFENDWVTLAYWEWVNGRSIEEES